MEISHSEKKAARWAHDLFILNVFFFHLLLTPATIMLDIGIKGLLIPLALSLSVIAYIYFRGQRERRWFVAAHWRLAFKRCRLLLFGYAITAAILLVAELITSGMTDVRMAEIMVTVITRIAIMPTLILVMVSVVLEASATSLVNKGEVPEKILREFPPHSHS
ncbi:MAG TPA: hypothetical protein ENG92_01965 [Thiolapillus brandeum]|uniref:Uncharacterized protein n=1 Tax=Thiolapillus brandeum TaxID=1076588 RepID=A0A831KBD9_9GAMM|nr:hypothetical protein [Thiolapillus brandeum]